MRQAWTSEHLLRQCKKNNRKAQNELFRRYKGLVMAICRRYGDGSQQVEDAFQECFIQIFRSLQKGKEITNLEGWIAQISIYTNINQYYAHRQEAMSPLKDDLLHVGHKEILESMTADEILGAIHQLPSGFRVVFNLYFIDGYNHREIAEKLRISESTSRSQLHRAKAHLRDKLEALGIYRYEAS